MGEYQLFYVVPLENVLLGSKNEEVLNVVNRACLMSLFHDDKTKVEIQYVV